MYYNMYYPCTCLVLVFIDVAILRPSIIYMVNVSPMEKTDYDCDTFCVIVFSLSILQDIEFEIKQ